MSLANKITDWLKFQVEKANSKGVVIGLSGGVDSAVVSVLAQKAFKNNVLAIIIPCHSSAKDLKDANLLAKKFNIKTKEIKIDSIYYELTKILPEANLLASANLKPRLRMLILYYFANKLNYLVAGTGNKSEIAVGYFTKYGDGGVDLLPIGGLLKTEVWQLAKELKIPPAIIEKAPSAGLWEGQTDENEMGITYKELDKTIIAIETGNYKGINKSVLSKVNKLIQCSAHKKSPIPIFKP
ncbi:MAG: NAD+ synthase [bacterium]|nr:NAD+ synthase [bacterium]